MAQEVYRIDERDRTVSFYLELGEGEHVPGEGPHVFLTAMTFEELAEGWLAPWLGRRTMEAAGGLDAVILDAVTEVLRAWRGPTPTSSRGSSPGTSSSNAA